MTSSSCLYRLEQFFTSAAFQNTNFSVAEARAEAVVVSCVQDAAGEGSGCRKFTLSLACSVCIKFIGKKFVGGANCFFS